MQPLTAEWVRKAEADYVAAHALARERSVNDAICFHCQQSAEKYLKALLHHHQQSIPKTHDLDALNSLLLVHCPALRSLCRGLQFLTQIAVETRYPGDIATKRQVNSALRWLETVRAECRALLGLPRRTQRSRRLR